MCDPDTDDLYRQQIGLAASDERLVRLRVESARLIAEGFSTVGTELHLAGHLLGTNRRDGLSPFGHGSDEVVAVSVLLRIAGQLVLGSVNLFDQGIPYAAAALLRQLVEIEYLTWAFEARHGDAERWLRSGRHERERFFSPAKLRRAANGKFGTNDYSHHCEFGGHPVPNVGSLLNGDSSITQLLIADLLGHSARIWNHAIGWANRVPLAEPSLKHHAPISARLQDWWDADPLADYGLLHPSILISREPIVSEPVSQAAGPVSHETPISPCRSRPSA